MFYSFEVRRDRESMAAAKRKADDGPAVVSVGDAVPAGITLDLGFPPEKIDLAERCNKKNIILLGLPGAFTPT